MILQMNISVRPFMVSASVRAHTACHISVLWSWRLNNCVFWLGVYKLAPQVDCGTRLWENKR